tara:strand:+ start:1747 stop:1878 length:132 start_codon:yes stop_codon:yes gene_type:complete
MSSESNRDKEHKELLQRVENLEERMAFLLMLTALDPEPGEWEN